MTTPDYHPFRSAKTKRQYLTSYDKRAGQYWPITSESIMVETSYGQTFTRVSGQDDKPPLVLLPGGNTTSLMWWQNIITLSDHYKTYAVDNISDFGRSIPTGDTKSPGELVGWLNELFNGLGLKDDVNLVGLSYGGWLASLYALRFQDRINKMVLLAPAATILPLCKEFWIRVILRVLIPHRYFTKNMLYWICEDLHQKDETSQAVLEDAVDDLYTATRCFKPRNLPAPTVLKDEELQQIKTPTLYLVGENERIYSADNAIQRLNSIAPQIKTEIIRNAGHDLVFVQPEIINSKILEFLK